MAERVTLPVLPLRNMVLLPGPTVSLTVGRKGSLKAVERASQADGRLFCVAQREDRDDASPDKLYGMGVIARIVQVQRAINGMQVAVTGETRAAALEYKSEGSVTRATVLAVEQHNPVDVLDSTFVALFRELRERATELGGQRGLPDEVLQQVLDTVTEPGDFADLVTNYLELPVPEKQALLETLGVEDRLRKVLVLVQGQLNLLSMQKDIREQVQEQLGGRQREMLLREQMRAIRKELGEEDQGGEVEALREKVAKLELPHEARTEAERELQRLERMGGESMEAQVARNYLQWLTELPWGVRSDDRLDLERAAQILEEDHYGLRDVKDRVLEFLAVRQLKARRTAAAAHEAHAQRAERESRGDDHATPETDDEREAKARALARGPILLFVGPPGVGKTSIAQSIARALDRSYVRISLGGARDEADIRGHRRTYVGAMPGRIIQGMKRAGTQNPVFLLDEVDKLGVSFQGDPASALLEVLDPAQNNTFTDHYMNVPFDLSQVLFIATANLKHPIPPPLLDRMEVVEFAGYTEREKKEIARRYLVPRQVEENGLDGESAHVTLTDEALFAIINQYTRESGVRQLEREIGSVLRKLARRIAAGQEVDRTVAPELVRELLGRPRVHPERAGETDEVGVATGMYFSPTGGDIMFVEAAVRSVRRHAQSEPAEQVEGLGDVALILTGQLGDVMKESARAALTYAATHAESLQIPVERLGALEAHVHVPAGAIPKDGPSAGIPLAAALASALSRRAVRKDLAMTGEITLRGRVMPVGGIKEKVLGAHRAGIRKVVLPKDNEPDLEDVPDEVRHEMEFHFLSALDEVFTLALVPLTAPAQSESELDKTGNGGRREAPQPWSSSSR
jgi:ATP-dependent Lon protease